MDVLELAEGMLRQFPELSCRNDGTTVTADAATAEGFSVWLSTKTSDGEISVGFDGWYMPFDDVFAALNCLAFGLTKNCRLKVIKRGANASSYVAEFKDGSGWSSFGVSTHYPQFRFWKKKRSEYLTNDVIKDTSGLGPTVSQDDGITAVAELLEKAGIDVPKADSLGLFGLLSKRLTNMLSASPAIGNTVEVQTAADLAEQTTTALKSVKSYCAMLTMTSCANDELIASWRHDVVLPDRFHARQAVHIENAYDEWMRFDGKEYRFLMAWIEQPQARENNADNSVNLSIFETLLKKCTPTECRECRLLDEDFFEFVYRPPYDFGRSDGAHMFGEADDMTGGWFKLFVNANTSLIEKAKLKTRGRLDGELIDEMIDISFAAFNEDIEVGLPDDFLPKTDGPGGVKLDLDRNLSIDFHAW